MRIGNVREDGDAMGTDTGYEALKALFGRAHMDFPNIYDGEHSRRNKTAMVFIADRLEVASHTLRRLPRDTVRIPVQISGCG